MVRGGGVGGAVELKKISGGRFFCLPWTFGISQMMQLEWYMESQSSAESSVFTASTIDINTPDQQRKLPSRGGAEMRRRGIS